MPENQNANGEHWTRESVSILKQLGWTQRGSCNFDIECIHHVKERKGQKHGVDSFFEYYDPYYKSTQGILVESKCWEFKSITTANIKKYTRAEPKSEEMTIISTKRIANTITLLIIVSGEFTPCFSLA